MTSTAPAPPALILTEDREFIAQCDAADRALAAIFARNPEALARATTTHGNADPGLSLHRIAGSSEHIAALAAYPREGGTLPPGADGTTGSAPARNAGGPARPLATPPVHTGASVERRGPR